MRWDLFLQGFQIRKEYIKGEDNAISDTFSRLCKVSDINEYIHPLLEQSIDDELLYMMTEDTMDVETINHLINASPISAKHYKIISSVHNSLVGHHGVERTLKKLIMTSQTY